ncbi:MAG TPA: Hsp20/alpha crystallin family protein [Steroidobacteraceae bacterium]|nr:Hsp20/alpha crystallin family protein [Steroidobacteraceae bacterium]
MNDKQGVATQEPAGVENKSRGRETALIPAVDIFEDAHQITVQAEMPGVAREKLNVQADRNELLIEGDVQIDMPTGMAALYADLQTTRYRRSFVLSSELETERIEASLKDGLLTVRIPKRVEFRTRKIKVNVP